MKKRVAKISSTASPGWLQRKVSAGILRIKRRCSFSGFASTEMSPRYLPEMHELACPVLMEVSFHRQSGIPSPMQSHLLEKALTVIKSEQILVNMISRRVRQLMNGHRPMVEVEPRMGYSDIALKEVIDGKLGFEKTAEFIAEPIAPHLARRSEVTVEKQAA
jgi:DNA-directed RNA polymerase subunit omega